MKNKYKIIFSIVFVLIVFFLFIFITQHIKSSRTADSDIEDYVPISIQVKNEASSPINIEVKNENEKDLY